MAGRKRNLRVGAVSYLNTKPLVWGLAEASGEIELSFDYPSRLADRLAAGALDVALIPSVESFQDPNYRIVSNACIGCRGPVLSVKLLSRVPVERIRSLALDEGSRTSAALVRVLLAERHGISPEPAPWPLEADAAMATTDAVLLIGDRAMHSPGGPWELVWDLGDQWCRWTELPFVFAMWTARAGLSDDDLAELDAIFSRARDEGVNQLEAIAAAESPRLGLTEPECYNYLRHNLHFTLGPREQEGLVLFQRLAAGHGLAPAGVELDFFSCPTAR